MAPKASKPDVICIDVDSLVVEPYVDDGYKKFVAQVIRRRHTLEQEAAAELSVIDERVHALEAKLAASAPADSDTSALAALAASPNPITSHQLNFHPSAPARTPGNLDAITHN